MNDKKDINRNKTIKGTPVLFHPKNREIKIWRYLSLPKLISFLDKKQLHLCRVDLLNDPYEGSLPLKSSQEHPSDLSGTDNLLFKLLVTDFRRNARKTMYVNCWHMDNDESEAMWKLYCGRDSGIALQTTYEKLFKIIQPMDNFYFGRIKYLDYATDVLPVHNIWQPFFHKRKAFLHEQEVRILHHKKDLLVVKNRLPDFKPGPAGITISVIPEKLIENIFVNPYAPDWYFEVVQSVVKKCNSFVNIKWSQMRRPPNYFN